MHLIFIHIPKTSGLSFAAALRYVYGKEYNAYRPLGIRPEDDDLLYTNYANRKTTWAWAMDRLPERVNWLTDHAPVQLYDGLLPDVPRVTWLRDPVQRVVSAYIHDLTHEIVEPCGIHDYIHMPRKRNVMTLFTAGGDLDQFIFVGIAERFAHDLGRLARLLDWPPDYPVVHNNTTRDPGMKEKLLSDRALINEIKILNRPDCELYDRALEVSYAHPTG